MNFFSQYIAYLKHNPEGYWFKRKLYGWGWVPATWQGWLTLAVFVFVLARLIVPFSHSAPKSSDTIWFLVEILLWVAALILVCYLKGEPPQWQWGTHKEPKDPQGPAV